MIKLGIMNADAVIVSTSLLAEKVKPLNKNVHIISNYCVQSSKLILKYV
jgi:hypothetical protein